MEIWENFNTDVALERRICSQYLIRLKPAFLCVARCAENSDHYPKFEQPFMDELFERLYTYSEKIYVMERDGEIWGFVPAMFFSSAMVLALKFNIDAGVVLRCLDRSEYSDILEFSPNISVKRSRSTKIGDDAAAVDALLCKIKKCFFEPRIVSDDSALIISELEKLSISISELVGTPVGIGRITCEKKYTAIGKIDFPLFSAFLMTLLLLARENALDRSAKISFRMLSQSVVAIAHISAEEEDFARATALWEGICADMLMPFGVFWSDGILRIGFQPCRRELSYLGLKQTSDWLYT